MEVGYAASLRLLRCCIAEMDGAHESIAVGSSGSDLIGGKVMVGLEFKSLALP